MNYVTILYIVFGQIPHSVVSATKDRAMGLLIKLSSSSCDLECENLWL